MDKNMFFMRAEYACIPLAKDRRIPLQELTVFIPKGKVTRVHQVSKKNDQEISRSERRDHAYDAIPERMALDGECRGGYDPPPCAPSLASPPYAPRSRLLGAKDIININWSSLQSASSSDNGRQATAGCRHATPRHAAGRADQPVFRRASRRCVARKQRASLGTWVAKSSPWARQTALNRDSKPFYN